MHPQFPITNPQLPPRESVAPRPPRAPLSAFSIQHSAFTRRRGGFTLIEILVVVAIIVILVGISVGVGTQVKTNASIRSTHATLKTLEGIMKDYLAAGNPEPQDVTDPNDQIVWVQDLRANPEYAKKLASLPQGITNSNVSILDGFGTAIRYIPYNSTYGAYNTAGTKKEGYFWSAGPDTKFVPAPPTVLPAGQAADDLYSTDP